MTRTIVLLMALIVWSSGPAAAQQETRTGHAAAAAELIALLNLEQQATAGLKAAFAAQPAPLAAGAGRFAEVMTAFMEEFLPWEVLEPEYVRIYQDAFTEAELRELVAFYSTPIGRKLVEATPQMAVETMAVTQRLMAPHMPELQRRMMASMGRGPSRP